jgi:hypothetical protein
MLHMEDVFGVGKIVDKALDPVVDLVKKVAGPAAEEIGLTLQDSVRVYRAKRQYRLLYKVQESLADTGTTPRNVSMKVLLPSLEYASVEDDEDLHTMWANLLSNAADPSHDEVLPSFPEILKQLTKPAATFLNGFYDFTRERMGGDAQVLYRCLFGEIGQLFFDLTRLGAEDLAITLDDLQRLRLIEKDPIVHIPSEDSRGLQLSLESTTATVTKSLVITFFGIKFVKACRRPTKA